MEIWYTKSNTKQFENVDGVFNEEKLYQRQGLYFFHFVTAIERNQQYIC